MGAGGKMGCRIIDHLHRHPDYRLRCVEVSPAGLAQLARRGLDPTPVDEALAGVDAVILALPDLVLGKVAQQVVPLVKPGCLVVTLDPAAAHAGCLPARSDISYFVTHPCHPSVFEYEENPRPGPIFLAAPKRASRSFAR